MHRVRGIRRQSERLGGIQLLESGQVNISTFKQICADPIGVRRVFHTYFVPYVMVVGNDNTDYQVMIHHIFFQVIKINDNFTDLLDTGVNSWMDGAEIRFPYSQVIQKLQASNFHDHTPLNIQSYRSNNLSFCVNGFLI